MKILFIGGTGNISTDCARLLYERGHEISVVTRGSSVVPEQYTAIQADRFDAESMKNALADVEADVVINFMGFKPPELQTDYEVFRGRIRQYIFISSATVYAKPHRELPLTESSPLGNDFSEYARNKQACEEWLLDKMKEDGFPVTIVRPSHTYSHSWLPNPVASAGFTLGHRLRHGKPVLVPGNGQSLWTLTATTDFAVGLAGLAGQDDALGEAFHITSDEPLTWNQITAEAVRALGASNPVVEQIPVDFICKTDPSMPAKMYGDKAGHAVFDNAKIKRFVDDFQCRKPLRDGMTEAAAWFDAHPDQQVPDPEIDATFDKIIDAWRAEKT